MREQIKRCTPESVKKLYRKLRSAVYSTVRPYRDAHALESHDEAGCTKTGKQN